MAGESTHGEDLRAYSHQPHGARPERSLEAARKGAGSGGIDHFGFRLTDSTDIDMAVKEVKRAGGTIDRRGEFGPRLPYAFVLDPDGYEIEIWYE